MIDEPYLLVTHIACYRSGSPGQDQRATDALWQKDLMEHLNWIRDLRLAAPVALGACPAGACPIGDTARGGGEEVRLRHVDLPHATTRARALLVLPAVLARLWRAVGEASIVHIGVVGGAIPYGWLAAGLARLRGKRLVVVVESAPWRLDRADETPQPLRRRLRAALWERMARWCTNLADIAFFTQSQYLHSLLRPQRRRRGHVVHASWVDAEQCLSVAAAEESWQGKLVRQQDEQPLRLVFAGRLCAAKGVLVLLEAMRHLERQGVAVELDVFGVGELAESCRQAEASLQGPARLRMRGVIPYGAGFLAALRQYHALVVPSLSDEQPRIVYDAFSQAVGVLASDTAGLRDCVRGGCNGILVARGEAWALAGAIAWAAGNRQELRRLGTGALESAQRLTHRQMHRTRCQLIEQMLRRQGKGECGPCSC